MAEADTGETGRQFALRILRRSLATISLILAAIYVIDSATLRYRIWAARSPFDTVTVQVYDAVAQKNHSTEFLVEDPQSQTCVNSLFPHLGHSPCWYLRRHPEQRRNI